MPASSPITPVSVRSPPWRLTLRSPTISARIEEQAKCGLGLVIVCLVTL